jgi:large repetitive protein
VSSSQPISVTQLSGERFVFDAALAIPRTRVGDRYRAASYAGTGAVTGNRFQSNSRLSVVGVEDNTVLTITPQGSLTYSVGGTQFQKTAPFTFTIGAHDIFEAHASNNPIEMTGTLVTANKPVTFYATHACTEVPIGPDACNHLLEHMPPVARWGKKFLVAPFGGRNSGYVIRVVADEGSTEVRRDGVLVSTLAAGAFYEFQHSATSYAEYTTSKPAFVYQLAKGVSTEPGYNINGGFLGDPTSMIVVPTEQFGNRATVQAFDGFPRVDPDSREAIVFSSHLTLIVPTSSISGMLVDNQPLTASWTPIGAGAYSAARVSIAAGAHQVRHVLPNVRFIAYVYGWARFDAYAYPAGMQIARLYGSCQTSSTVPGDGQDNDCDAAVDEELDNDLDDDGDGLIDEDLSLDQIVRSFAPIAFDSQRGTDEDTPSGGIVLAAFDADGDSLRYDIVRLPDHGGLGYFVHQPSIVTPQTITSTVNVGPIVRYVPDNGFIGTDSFTFRATDGDTFSNTATVTVVVMPRNTRPTITSSPVLTVNEGSAYSYQVTASDPDDGDSITFSILEGPSTLTVGATSGVVSWSPGEDDVGTHPVTVAATDLLGETGTQRYTLTVVNVQDPPVISSDPIPYAFAGSLYSYQASVTDPDRNDTVHWQLLQAPSGVSLSATTGLLEWRPSTNQIATHEVTIKAIDSAGLWATQGFTIQVRPANRPPAIVSSPGASASPFVQYTYTVAATDADVVYGDTIAFSLRTFPSGMTINGQGQISWTPQLSQLGSQAVVVRATDNGGAFVEQHWYIDVRSSNRAPRIVSSPRQLGYAEESYTYQVEVSDPDPGDTRTFTLLSGPPGMGLSSSGVLSWNPTLDDLGTHGVSLRVTDRELATDTQSFAVEVVEENFAPEITSNGPTAATQGVLYTYQIVVNDPNPLDRSSFTIIQGPAGMMVSSDGLVKWTPRSNQVTTHTVRLRATDYGGLYDEELFTIAVTNVNDPPEFTSSPITAATQDVSYLYDANASDPDGDAFTFLLDQGPSGMTIDVSNGAVHWTPRSWQIGSHSVRLRVRDTHNDSTLQSFTIVVANVNDPPVITSEPDLVLVQGAPYTYRVRATDPDPSDSLTFSLISPPTGMGINSSTGIVSWTPSNTQLGQAFMRVKVTDPTGAFATQTSTLTVVEDEDAPRVSVSFNPEIVNVGQNTVATVSVSDNASIASVSLTIGGVPVTLNANRQATYTPASSGVISAQATATDVAGNTGTGSGRLGVRNPNDTTPPVVAISYPADDQIIIMPEEVIGTASDAALLHYTLSLRADGEVVWSTIVTGTLSVTNGALGTFDPTVRENGWYTLRLDAVDASGNRAATELPIEIQGQAKIGVVRLSFIDLAIPVSGIPVTVGRTYDSRVKTKQDFGIGWDLDVTAGRLQHNRTPGIGWQITSSFPPPGVACAVVNELSSHYTTVRLSDREWYSFRPTIVNRAAGFGGCFGEVAYEFVDSSGGSATLDILGNVNVFHLSGSNEVVDDINFLPFNPQVMVLETFDGRTVTVKRGVGITEIEDVNGNYLRIGATGLTHSSGRGISFTRDSQGRITQIRDPANQTLTYAYDSRGDLTTITDAAGGSTSFTYDSQHNLVDIINPLGFRATRMEYDESGRLIATIDAQGRRIEIEHDLDAQAEVTTDRLGKITIHYYDAEGNVVRKIDPLLHEWNFTYDDRGNELTARDPLGRTSTKTYDLNNRVLTSIDAEGHSVTFTRNARGQVLTSLDSRGRLITNTYSAGGNLLTTTDGEDETTSYTYDSRGNTLTVTDPLNHTTTFTYDAAGNQLTRTDPLGNVTTTGYDILGRRTSETRTRTMPGGGEETIVTRYAYDANGKPTTTTDPLGYSTAVLWDALGKPTVSVGKNGLVTRFVSNSLGLLNRIEYADGSYDETTYDAEGRVLSERDREGNVTTHEYDDLGRRTKTTYPDASFTQTTYDPIGRPLTTRDVRGGITSYAYGTDTTTITDPLGHTTVKVEDADGNIVEQIDELGRSTRFTYDLGSAGQHGQGRLIRTDFADGTFTTITYDDAGRKVSETDELGRTTSFGYDNAGRLTSVTNSANETTTFGYDDLGNRTSITDANNHTTTFAFDAMGRMIRRTLPLGETETLRYDALGNLVAKTDMNGETTTYAYDQQGRMVSRTYPGSSPETFTYSALGRRLTAGAESFTYDSRGRLLTNTKATGEVLTYAYDAAGNRTSVSGPHGTTTYVFDADGRMTSVSHGGSTIATLGYDDASNVVSIARANGLTTTQSFDDRNRVLEIVTRDPLNVVVSSFSYTRDDTGRITTVAEAPGGRAISYGYDEVYRLESEVIADPVAGNRTIDYAYDAVGNRTSKVDSLLSTTTYAYDNNDRLLSETNPGGTTSYAYDDNGNVIEKAAPGGTTSFAYDARNLMIEATVGSIIHAYGYDVDGARISKSVNGVLPEAFLVDRNMPHAQVLRETNASGTEIARHVYGIDEVLWSMTAPGARFMHYDAQRSVRALSNAAGGVVDGYAFDAFGNALASSGSTPNDYRYSGERLDDETGLVYLRARQYDPSSGRFLGMDPFLGYDSQPATLHRYSYAANDGVNARDPSGEFLVGISFTMASLGNLINAASLSSAPTKHAYNIESYTLSGAIRIANARNLMMTAVTQGQSITHDQYRLFFDQKGTFPEGHGIVTEGFRAIARGFYDETIKIKPVSEFEGLQCEAGSPQLSGVSPEPWLIRLCTRYFAGGGFAGGVTDLGTEWGRPASDGRAITIFHEATHAVPGYATRADGRSGIAFDKASRSVEGAAAYARSDPREAVTNPVNWEVAAWVMRGWEALPSPFASRP